jgi:hypothetical protein
MAILRAESAIYVHETYTNVAFNLITSQCENEIVFYSVKTLVVKLKKKTLSL